MSAPQNERGCKCQHCGMLYRVDIMIPDDLWERISGGCNLLCGECIARRIETTLGFDAFRLVRIVEEIDKWKKQN